MTTSEIITALAILFSPLIAVQITRILDDGKASRERKTVVYRTLMATRAANLSHAHVEALNVIDIEFGRQSATDRLVRTAWKLYLDHLNTYNENLESWNEKRIELLVDLLFEMGKSLGFDYDKVHVKKGVYSPTAHGELESDQAAIRRGIKELLEGNRAIPIKNV